jgi:hypothetical protein
MVGDWNQAHVMVLNFLLQVPVANLKNGNKYLMLTNYYFLNGAPIFGGICRTLFITSHCHVASILRMIFIDDFRFSLKCNV